MKMGPYAVGFINICCVVQPQEILKGFSFRQKNICLAVPDMCPLTVYHQFANAHFLTSRVIPNKCPFKDKNFFL